MTLKASGYVLSAKRRNAHDFGVRTAARSTSGPQESAAVLTLNASGYVLSAKWKARGL